MSGLDLHTVGRLLGHADTGSIERSAHIAADPVQAATEQVTAKVAAILHEGREQACDAGRASAAR